MIQKNNDFSGLKERLIAQYKFDDDNNVGKDSSGNGYHGTPFGTTLPSIHKMNGRLGVKLSGGNSGTSFIRLPSDLLKDINDHTGLTISTWVNFGKGFNVWERIFDFGKCSTGPYIFMTRNLRCVCYQGDDIAVDPGKSFAPGEWAHITMSVIGTAGGTLSSAGPILYLNGELLVDGTISQTSSGNYAKLRQWFATLDDTLNYSNNYIGKSQYQVDADFDGTIADFRVYKSGLSQDEVIEIMCDALSDDEIVKLAREKYLTFPYSIITDDIKLPLTLMGGKVGISWHSDNTDVISHSGVVQDIHTSKCVTMTATLTRGNSTLHKSYRLSILPKNLPPYTLTVEGKNEVLNISKLLYGLFYEDINNAADGGLYAELIQNRSFEAFHYDTYSLASGENAISTGRVHHPLHAWSGDTNKMTSKNVGGLNEHFSITDKEINSNYVTVADGATILNKGFADSNQFCSMAIRAEAKYDFTIWAKAEYPGTIKLQLRDSDHAAISDLITIDIEGGNVWKKYGIESKLTLTASKTVLGQLALTFEGEISIDMVSLIPRDVWGATEEASSATAHMNYANNPNYRLRKDLVNILLDMHPAFLRFPGGCISEGSYIWDNVYDWKDSVDDVELRKENYNVWGYMMTMGLGYMEYFQLAEDLNATPLPVMACGVLCQARSDYANPAGGALRDRYVSNFTDLIDFAISTDYENNQWAALRKKMGHPEPFDLHYIGVGNENWGVEFFANFEFFKAAIDEFMASNYPGYELHIISTVGAQADDDAYQQGWKFLSGNYTEAVAIRFTDGVTSTEETVSWYQKQNNYMETIADEHFYRSNDYLKINADRYNYYYRAYHDDGSLNEALTSKVFVGEYASSDKNTLAGAVAEAAIMTSFENNSDVVRLTAYAPLFNKVLTDGLYRWTPDCIWFDNETVWRTPNYYVQQLFAKYLGTKSLGTSFSTYRDGNAVNLIPYGGIEIATGNAEIIIKHVKVTSNIDGKILLDQDFTKELSSEWNIIPCSNGYSIDAEKGLILTPQETGLNGLYMLNDTWTNYHVEVIATKVSGMEAFFVGVGLTDITTEKKDILEYAIGYHGNATGVKVYKQGIEGYTLGDYSSSTAAGNLRAASYEELELNTPYAITVNYGGKDGKHLVCSYTDGITASKVLDYKLEAYNNEIFHSVTKDDSHVYVKLVNPDHVTKDMRLLLQDINVVSEVRMITLTGDQSLLNKPNVNQRNNEIIAPVESTLLIHHNDVIVSLAANSVNVLVFDIA